MVYTRDWLEANPVDHTKFSAQPGNVRSHKVDVSDRLKTIFHGFIAGETQTDEGAKVLPFVVEVSDPGGSTDKIKLYAKDVGGKAELFSQDEDGNIKQLTSAGKLNVEVADISALACLLTTNQTVAGVKTFSSIPLIPTTAPTTNAQVAGKKYVDDQIAAIPGGVDSEFADIKDYGTSESAGTSKANNQMFIVFGQAVNVPGSSSTTITGLPFTSATSYKIVAGKTNASAAVPPAAVTISGSSASIINNHGDAIGGNGTFNWIAIGF